MPAPDALSLVFAALADPTRRAILSRLAQGPSTVGDVAAPFDMSAPAISQHLKVLERAGLVTRTRQAQWRTLTMRTAPLDEASAWVEHHRREWNLRLDALDAHLRTMTTDPNRHQGGSPMDTTTPSTHDTPQFTITREFDAPRDAVWRAWTDERELAAWLHPFGVSSDSVSFDVRVGGRYRYTMTNDETGEEYPTGGEFLEVEPIDRLVFTWGEPDAPADGAPVITLTFTDRGERTELVFHLHGIEGAPGDENVYDGWDEALVNLGRHLAGDESR